MKRITQDMYEQAHEYMQGWVQEEKWDDLAVMLMEGDTELAAHHLVESGGIDSKNCYEDAKELEQAIELMAKRFRKLGNRARGNRYDSVFKGCLVASCNECNAVSFVHSGNEDLYLEVKTNCFECQSTNIEVSRWGDK